MQTNPRAKQYVNFFLNQHVFSGLMSFGVADVCSVINNRVTGNEKFSLFGLNAYLQRNFSGCLMEA